MTKSFTRMDSESDKSDEDSMPEESKISKKKLISDMIFHMEM